MSKNGGGGATKGGGKSKASSSSSSETTAEPPVSIQTAITTTAIFQRCAYIRGNIIWHLLKKLFEFGISFHWILLIVLYVGLHLIAVVIR